MKQWSVVNGFNIVSNNKKAGFFISQDLYGQAGISITLLMIFILH